MNFYKALNNQVFNLKTFSLVPIRYQDRYDIMRWRNEQIYHLRQNKPLSKEEQDSYFVNIINPTFNEKEPKQVLFSFLEKNVCIGYGGLVHINWKDSRAEISFLINTSLEQNSFNFLWDNYLKLIEIVAFEELKLHKIYTYAFDLRPNLYEVLEINNYCKEAILKEHTFFNGKFINVVIHSKMNNSLER